MPQDDSSREERVNEVIAELLQAVERGENPDQERAVRLAEALGRLPEAQREAIVLQTWHQCTLAEIAERMGRTRAAVAGLLKRGLSQLRVEMVSRNR
jgi:RNA polymerase sigma factor (sigma-70 family)